MKKKIISESMWSLIVTPVWVTIFSLSALMPTVFMILQIPSSMIFKTFMAVLSSAIIFCLYKIWYYTFKLIQIELFFRKHIQTPFSEFDPEEAQKLIDSIKKSEDI